MSLRQPATISLGMVNSYLVPAGDGCALVDTGVAGHDAKIFAAMADLGLAPESLRLVFVTHAHGDHVGSLRSIVERSHALVLAHRSEAQALADGKALSPRGLTAAGKVLAATAGRVMRGSISGPAPADVLVDDELSLAGYGIAGRALHTPGHTAGSLTLLLDDGSAFVGDLCAHGSAIGGHSHLPPFGDDRDTIFASWQRLIAAGATTVYPGHGPTFPFAELEDELRQVGRAGASRGG
jgi:hydroxyacylglutathione hydrolase